MKQKNSFIHRLFFTSSPFSYLDCQIAWDLLCEPHKTENRMKIVYRMRLGRRSKHSMEQHSESHHRCCWWRGAGGGKATKRVSHTPKIYFMEIKKQRAKIVKKQSMMIVFIEWWFVTVFHWRGNLLLRYSLSRIDFVFVSGSGTWRSVKYRSSFKIWNSSTLSRAEFISAELENYTDGWMKIDCVWFGNKEFSFSSIVQCTPRFFTHRMTDIVKF